MGATRTHPSVRGGEDDSGKQPERSQLKERRETTISRAARPLILAAAGRGASESEGVVREGLGGEGAAEVGKDGGRGGRRG